MQDPGWGQSTSDWNINAVAARLGGGSRLGGGRTWNIEDVQLASGGRLNGELSCGIMGDMVAIHDVVVPVARTRVKHGSLEAERSLPRAGLGLGGKGKLAGIVVPGAQKMDGLHIGGGAKGEIELDGSGRHDALLIVFCVFFV